MLDHKMKFKLNLPIGECSGGVKGLSVPPSLMDWAWEVQKDDKKSHRNLRRIKWVAMIDHWILWECIFAFNNNRLKDVKKSLLSNWCNESEHKKKCIEICHIIAYNVGFIMCTRCWSKKKNAQITTVVYS